MESPEEQVTFTCQECGKGLAFPSERSGHVEECPHCHSYVDVPHVSEKSLPPGSLDSRSRTSAQLWIELLAVLCLAYVPYLFDAVTAINTDRPRDYNSVECMLYWIIGSLRVSLPLLVIMGLSKEPWSLFGIVRPAWFRDVLLTCAIWFGGTIAYQFALCTLPEWLLEESRSAHVAHRSIPVGATAYLLLLAATIASSCCEELVMRGYLLPRLERLLHSTVVAIIVTSVLFGSYHLYQGFAPAIGAAALGAFYGIAFCLTRRLWPVCAAHALHNVLLYL